MVEYTLMEERRHTDDSKEEMSKKELNISFAKSIDDFLLAQPEPIEYLVTFNNANGISESDIEKGFDIAKNELTLGCVRVLPHRTVKAREVNLEVAYNKDYAGPKNTDPNVSTPIVKKDLLPKDFNLPFYGIMLDSETLFDPSSLPVSSPYGNLPQDVIGEDGKLYHLENYFCFNFSGQGVKLEIVKCFGELEENFTDEDLQKARFKLQKVEFTPRVEHSRAVPITIEDYSFVSQIFRQIKSGIYNSESVNSQ